MEKVLNFKLEKQFNEDTIKKCRNQLYKDGYLLISRDELQGTNDFLGKINNINKKRDWFEFQKKQSGTKTLKRPILHQQDFITEYLFKSELLKKVFLYTGQILYLTNFKHYLNTGNEPSLGWHSDSYIRDNKAIGLIPAPYKIVLYSSKADKKNGCTEVLAGSHRFDLHNRWVDKAISLCRLRYHSVKAEPGDAILFNVNILHNRRATGLQSYRSATIFGMALSPFYQLSYAGNGNDRVISLYNSLLKKYFDIYNI